MIYRHDFFDMSYISYEVFFLLMAIQCYATFSGTRQTAFHMTKGRSLLAFWHDARRGTGRDPNSTWGFPQPWEVPP